MVSRETVSRLWLTAFTLVSIAANCASLIGCISPGVVNLCLYRVKVAVLAEGLQKLASNDSQNAPRLLHPELPAYWYWGMSGVCDVDSNGETRCRRQFPPTNNLITIVEESLRGRLGSGQEPLVNNIVSSWNATLDKIDPLRLRDKEAKFTTESKASVALALLAVILDVGIPPLALVLDRSSAVPYYASFFSALVSMGAGTLATYSMYDGVHGVVETGEHGGLGIILVFVGAALRVLSSMLGPCCASRSKDDGKSHSKDNDHNKRIGYLGEKHLFKSLERKRLPAFSWKNWTSNLRTRDGYEEVRDEWRYTDFTYLDQSAMMREVLRGWRVHIDPNWTNQTTYHLEVKTTDGDCERTLFVSPNQVEKMQTHNHDPFNAYILVRIFDVEKRKPQAVFFPNPWELMHTEVLKLGELQQRPNGNTHPVYITPGSWTATKL